MGSKIVIPDDTVETFKCSLCQNYLSVPPVMIITKDGEQQKCGRCVGVKTKLNTRNKFYENIIKFSSFPCIYPKCKEKMQWGEVGDHEKICPNRTVRCPLFFNKCDDIVEVSDFSLHSTMKHSDFLFYEKVVLKDIKLGFYYIRVLIKDNFPFLIYVNALREDFWVCALSVCSTVTEHCKYEVRLSSGDSKGPFLLYEDQTIIAFDEREHCSRCLADSCELKYHPFSKLYHIECEDVKTTIIDAEKAIHLLDTEVFCCTIDIVSGKKLSETSVEKDNYNEISTSTNNQLLRRVLQCPICMEYMVAPIYTCVTGHTICKICRLKLERCPTCVGDISITRQFALEEVSENIEIPCQYEGNGCNFKGNVERICRHEEICSSAP